MEYGRIEDDRPLPSTAAMLRAICSKEGIAEEEAKKRIEGHYEGNQLVNLQVAAYDYCISRRIKDKDIDKYDEPVASPITVEARRKLADLLQGFVRGLWDIREHGNEYFEEVVALLLDVFKINKVEELTSSQMLVVFQIIEHATYLQLTDGDVEKCLDLLDENKIKRFPNPPSG